MKKKIRLSFFILLVIFLLSACNTPEKEGVKKAVDKEYEYNTVILKNPNEPSAGKADIQKIDGYSEIAVEGLEFPYEIPDSHLVIESVGAYTGVYTEDLSMDNVDGIPAAVVRNTSDKPVSYASFQVQYTDNVNLLCGFACSNLNAGYSAVLLCDNKKLNAGDVTQFRITSPTEMPGESLTVLDGIVGVDYKDGKLILTNQTEDSLGTVYIRYKYIAGGNAYRGGVTQTVTASYLNGYDTCRLDAGDFDPDNCAIICVENDENTVNR